MSHHGPNPMPSGIPEDLAKQLGATGDYPEGKLAPNDEGGIKLAIGVSGGRIVIAFGKEVGWIGFNPDQAREVGRTLIKMAKHVQRQGG